MYLNEIDYNNNIETYEKKISIDGIDHGLGIEYFVSYLPERMHYNLQYYSKVKQDIVHEMNVIEWYLEIEKQPQNKNKNKNKQITNTDAASKFVG